jgi:hypothetical protein
MRKPLKPRSQNPILDRLEHAGKQSKAYHASKGLEKEIAKEVGGRRTAGSGNKKEKGDVRLNGVMRIEHKATQKKSFSVTYEMLEKIELAARGCDEIPILVVEFLDQRGDSTGVKIACVPFQDITDLIDAASTG